MRTAVLQSETADVENWLDEIDFIEELRLRRWARENYVSADLRNADWHPVVHEEMSRKDRESSAAIEPPLTSA